MIGRLTVSLLALAVATGIAALVTPSANPSTAAGDPSVGAAATGQASLRPEGGGGVKAAASASATPGQAAATGEVVTATLAGCREAAWPYAERSCGVNEATSPGRKVRVIQIDRIKPEGDVTAWAPPTISSSGAAPTTTQSIASASVAAGSAVQTVGILPPPRAAEFSAHLAPSPPLPAPLPAPAPGRAVVTASASAIVGAAERSAGEPAAASVALGAAPRVAGRAEVGRAVDGMAPSFAVQIAQAPRAAGSAAVGAVLDLRGAVSHVPVVAAASPAPPVLSATGIGVASLGSGAASAVAIEATSRVTAAFAAGSGSSAASILSPPIGAAPLATALAAAAPGGAASSSTAVDVGMGSKLTVDASAGPSGAAAPSAGHVGASRATASAVADSGRGAASPAAPVSLGTGSTIVALAMAEPAPFGVSAAAAVQVESTPKAAASAIAGTSRLLPNAVGSAAWGAFRTAGSAQVDGAAGVEGSADVAPVVALLPPPRPVEVASSDEPLVEPRSPSAVPTRAGVERRESAFVERRQQAAVEPSSPRPAAAPLARPERPERVRQAARVADPRVELRAEPREWESRRADRRPEAFERMERAPRRQPPQLEWVRETITHRLPDGRVYVTQSNPRLMDRRRWWDSDEDERPRMQARRPRGGDAVMGWLAGQ